MNFVTEQEAQSKICPILMLGSEHLGVGWCDASKCMMWRSDHLPYYEGDSDQPTPRGYCGLAGVPQREYP